MDKLETKEETETFKSEQKNSETVVAVETDSCNMNAEVVLPVSEINEENIKNNMVEEPCVDKPEYSGICSSTTSKNDPEAKSQVSENDTSASNASSSDIDIDCTATSFCNSAAEAIQKTIAEVLSAQSKDISLEEISLTSDLEENLRQKLADFENVVHVCCPYESKKIDIFDIIKEYESRRIHEHSNEPNKCFIEEVVDEDDDDVVNNAVGHQSPSETQAVSETTASESDKLVNSKLPDSCNVDGVGEEKATENDSEPDSNVDTTHKSLPEEEDGIKYEEFDLLDDIDLSSIQVNQGIDVMSVCSTAAEAIKRTISEALTARDQSTSFAEGDSTSRLEASLKEKIADFKNVVEVCCPVEIAEVEDGNTSKEEIENTSSSKENEEKNCAEKEKEITVPDDKSVKPVIENEVASQLLVEESKNEVFQNASKVQEVKFPAYAEEKPSKKQKNSNKKKAEKTIDQVLKSLSNYSTPEEKLQALCKKHVETLDELKSIEPRVKQCERHIIALNREKEQLQGEHNRTILAKSRLESLCRELQRQNKAIKEESLIRIKEEEEKRKEVANKFQSTLNDISNLMQENSKKNTTLREENGELAKKLKSLVDHYEMWEKHMEKVVQQKDLEAQLAKAKHAKINLLLKQETEKFLREKQFLLENMSELQKKCTTLASNELQLRTELGDYTSKYEEFQTVLNKSSQVFASFKSDMETTSRKIKKLEKETNIYKHKWESSHNALLDMISDKQKRDKELKNAQQRVATLEKLCRALQAERNDLQNQVNTLSSTRKEEAKENPSLPMLETDATP